MAADRPRQAATIKLWSVDYFRFWVARRLIPIAPAFLFAGEPLFNLFLRCLGAKIGARAVISTAAVPVAADLFEVGEDAVIARRVMAPGYGAVGQDLSFGAIRIGKGAFVGEGACSTSTPRSAISRSSAMSPRCSAASASPMASAITARRPRRRTPASASSRTDHQPPAPRAVHARPARARARRARPARRRRRYGTLTCGSPTPTSRPSARIPETRPRAARPGLRNHRGAVRLRRS